MPYTDKASVESYILKTIAAEYNTQITQWINAISRHIDKTTNRVIATNTPSTIKYDGSGGEILLIRDCCDITEVKLDTVVLTLSDVLQYPTTKPYASRLVLQGGYRWTEARQNVEVTGKHGMATTPPEDIKLATTILVGAICRNQILGEKAGTTEKIGSYSVSYSTPEQKAELETAKAIINGYKRIAL